MTKLLTILGVTLGLGLLATSQASARPGDRGHYYQNATVSTYASYALNGRQQAKLDRMEARHHRKIRRARRYWGPGHFRVRQLRRELRAQRQAFVNQATRRNMRRARRAARRADRHAYVPYNDHRVAYDDSPTHNDWPAYDDGVVYEDSPVREGRGRRGDRGNRGR